jgi:RNA polymerase sigma-70 factor (ECF subfamily)
MPSLPSNQDAEAGRRAWFATTHWSVVRTAADNATSNGQEALETLCRTYWSPLYYHVRRLGYGPEEAQDLTQAFFARFLEKNTVRLANRELGRFRTFLLTSLNHFLAHEWERAHAAKRGGAHPHLPWDQSCAESQYLLEPVSELSPEKLFDQRWALTLFQQALTRLRAEYETGGKAAQFDALKGFLTDAAEDGYAGVASRLGTSAGSVAVGVHRLRRRYGELVREEVAHTVASRVEIQEELRYLIELASA